MKSLRQNSEYDFHELFVSAQETAPNQGFSLDMPRLTPRQINRCNVAAATNEEYFRVGIFIPFWTASLQISSWDLLPTNPLLVDCSV